MKYQAVARDLSGEVLGNQNISLRVSLYTRTDRSATTYSETHTVTTNQLGLFTLTIGKGIVESGKFSQVPWSTSDIWMEIGIKERKDSDFSIISTSKMLSVPYAFHAATASELVDFGTGNLNRGNNPGVNSQNWSLFGNSKSDPADDKLGTTDMADLVIVTNNIERMRVFTDGDIEILNSLTVDKDFTVKYNVALNTYGGATVNYGPLTVQNASPTLLSGTLTVDEETDLNSSLNVDGPTDLNSSLSVNNMSPTILSGTLLTEGDATFNEFVFVDNPAYNSTLITNGALVVSGGVGIGLNLNVGGDARFEGDVEINGPLALTDATSSTSPTTGALTVVGGTGIGENLNVGGITKFGTGSFTPANYPLIIQGSSQGIAIKVTGSRSGANNFVSFHDDDGQWGAIQGQTIGELATEPEFLWEMGFLAANGIISIAELGVAVADVVIAAIEVIQAAVDLAAASTSSTGCAGLGACVTVPIPSFIVSNTANIIVKAAVAISAGVNVVIVTANGIVMVAEVGVYEGYRFGQVGVTYSSGAGDYAEWLPKANLSEKFFPGDIIGIKGGLVTKNTNEADYIMVISERPIVLGNMPEKGKEMNYERVAFMGQVPVKVFGKVNVGDYIVPSGHNNGYGRAVPSQNMAPEDYQQIVGIAWSASHSDHLGYVNVAVGLNSNDVTRLVIDQDVKLQNQEDDLQALKTQVAQISELLAKLASGGDAQMIAEELQSLGVVTQIENDAQMADTKIVYFEVTTDQLLEGFELAKSQMRAQGIDVDHHPFFSQLDADPKQKARIIEELKVMVDNATLDQYETDLKSGALVELDFEPAQTRHESGFQREMIKMSYVGAEAKLRDQGVNIDEHPFFKKINTDPEGIEKFTTEMQQLLNNAEQINNAEQN